MESTGPKLEKELCYFISYASEDKVIKDAVQELLNATVGQKVGGYRYAKIWSDTFSLPKTAGEEEGFKREIEKNLERSHRLIVIYTGTEKPSHSFTGWEVGYFLGFHKEKSPQIKNKIIPIYNTELPSTLKEIEGLKIDIVNEKLRGKKEDFLDELKKKFSSNLDDPFFQFLATEIEIIDTQIIPANEKLPDVRLDDLIVEMYSKIFEYFKRKIDTEFRPQKQIIIKADSSELRATDNKLPETAQICILERGISDPMSLFGISIPNDRQEITWGEFISRTQGHELSRIWQAAINNVILSALKQAIPIDDYQVISSWDRNQVYRIVLTRDITYFDSRKEFHIYFLPVLTPNYYGDEYTTKLLVALEIVCRFRFLFLEQTSPYSSFMFSVSETPLVTCMQDLIRELDLIHFKSVKHGLALGKTDGWEKIVKPLIVIEMFKAWQPFDKGLRSKTEYLISSSTSMRKSELDTIKQEIVNLLEKLVKTIRPYNTYLMVRISERLKEVGGNEEEFDSWRKQLEGLDR